MKYRNFPFGYRMENGKIRINEKEAETVQMIFREYIGGIARRKPMEQKPCQKNY